MHDEKSIPTFLGICAGFERGEWRGKRLAERLFSFIPEFSLPYSEIHEIESFEWVDKMRKAISMIYETRKFENRGEFGELLLHCVLKDFYKTLPAISKMYFKDGPNETVKGFDAVHVVVNDDDSLDLWLGEVKFYGSATKAINDVVPEIQKHFKENYLRNEFIAITNKLDKQSPFYERLRNLISPDSSLDDIFEKICVPVLITFNSKVIDRYNKSSKEYMEEMKEEMEKYAKQFSEQFAKLGIELEVHLFLLPLKTKQSFVQLLDEKLNVWKQI